MFPVPSHVSLTDLLSVELTGSGDKVTVIICVFSWHPTVLHVI